MNKPAIYPVEPWAITESKFEIGNNYRNETAFALSNGYIGTRGTFEENYHFDVNTGLEGNFVNGFYESERIRYGEANFGSPLWSQSLLNLPNLKETRLYINGEEFRMDHGKVTDYNRSLNMKKGILTRKLTWISPKGCKVRIEIERLVSFERLHIMAINYQVTPLNFEGDVVFESVIEGSVENHTRKTNPIVDYGPFGRKLDPDKVSNEGTGLYYQGTTQNSNLTVGCGSMHQIYAGGKHEPREVRPQNTVEELRSTLRISAAAAREETIVLEKMICYMTSLDVSREELDKSVAKELYEASKEGYAFLKKKQAQYLAEFWDVADIEIDGEESESLVQGLHFNLFHIFQAAGRNGRTGMGAKGLSGEGYEGHYFWDTEMYILPVFIYTRSDVARLLLEYRYNTLEQARDRARVLGHEKGALFPWRTINGEEASTYYPLGTAQYHIDADIAYAVSLYVQVTGDEVFLAQQGVELLIETARIWADVGCFAESRGGRYCICSVTGPDEYNAIVDNNFYTNLMARENLRDAIRAVGWLKKENVEKYHELAERLEFREEEIALWKEIVEKMYFPYDEEKRIYPLDDGFMMRKPWDESRIPVEKRAWLYENYHPLFIMRHRMCKQADAILGFYLHSHLFDEDEIRRNYDFYQKVTLHHSSLSTCIFGIVACDIGYMDEAYEYFSQSARMDLDDYHNNFYAGIHAANMGGTWLAIINGFAGVRCQEGILRYKPHIPKQWKRYSFKLRYRDSVIRTTVSKGEACFELCEGKSAVFMVNGHDVSLVKGDTYIEKL